MKKMTVTGIWVLLVLGVTLFYAQAADMRETERAVQEKKNALMKKATEEKHRAVKEARETRLRILSDKNALTDAVRKLKDEAERLDRENQALALTKEKLVEKEKELNSRLGEVDSVIHELVGVIRVNAGDLDGLLDQNLQSALLPERGDRLKAMKEKTAFPGMEDIRYLVDLYFDEIGRSGEVRIEKGTMIRRNGEEITGNILAIGNFTAAYRLESETGFLTYSPSDRRLSALPKLPPANFRRSINQYMAGKSLDVPVDVSRGGALRQLTHHVTFTEQIGRGGPIVWPILAIMALAVVLICERVYFLSRKKMGGETFVGEAIALASREKWDELKTFCEQHRPKPLANIILSGLKFRHSNREDMENAVQETILREIPPMERFLSTLGMLATIEPLLGLLGTVTGMINTFNVITYYGSGDPRMMSAGISEALVTTMLGLMAAIPIMFVHTLLSRRVENMIGEMEEKAVSFINTVYKTRFGHG